MDGEHAFEVVGRVQREGASQLGAREVARETQSRHVGGLGLE